VRVPVENGEEADQHCSDPKWRLGRAGDHEAQRHAGERDAHLHPGHRHAHHAKRAAKGHHDGKYHRQQPHRGRAEIRAPQAHGDHGHDMIEPGQRMPKAADEAANRPSLRMRVHRGWENEQKQHDQSESVSGRQSFWAHERGL